MIPITRVRRAFAAYLLLAGVSLVAGCRHKPNPVVLAAQAQTPEPLVTPPEPLKPPVVEPQPLPKAPVVVVKPPRKPRRRPAPVVPKPADASAPVQVASAATPALSSSPDGASVIGALTAGGDASPQKHQQAADLIAASTKRLAELPASLVDQLRVQVGQVKNFLRQSQAALDSGDSEGSLNLATKAKLLLDDLTK